MAEMIVDTYDMPAVADIETRLKGTKNAVFANYAFGVPRWDETKEANRHGG